MIIIFSFLLRHPLPISLSIEAFGIGWQVEGSPVDVDAGGFKFLSLLFTEDQ